MVARCISYDVKNHIKINLMNSFEVNSFIFNAVRHLGAQVAIERYGQFLFMPVLGLVILLYSYHGMMSVPTVKK